MSIRFGGKIVSFLRNEDGPTPVQYAVMLAIIIVVCLVAITALGTNANTSLTNLGTGIAGTGS
jgi:pilus assembly protein Flp/PilA